LGGEREGREKGLLLRWYRAAARQLAATEEVPGDLRRTRTV